jgi:hypothetical protein
LQRAAVCWIAFSLSVFYLNSRRTHKAFNSFHQAMARLNKCGSEPTVFNSPSINGVTPDAFPAKAGPTKSSQRL